MLAPVLGFAFSFAKEPMEPSWIAALEQSVSAQRTLLSISMSPEMRPAIMRHAPRQTIASLTILPTTALMIVQL
jgi:hypothetical protein